MNRKPGAALTKPLVRTAIYCRKSTDDGLDQDFNSIEAQREACEAFIASRKHEGWVALPQRYDDGGYSGATADRPAYRRILQDVERGLVDCVAVYKVDRFSRSLLDFTKTMDVFEQHGVSFVSVTQQFDTSTSMGRLTLNVLLSFSQFEREVICERIRDKVAAAKRKGKFTGGTPPLGYDVHPKETKLIVNRNEARLVQRIFRRFGETGSALTIAAELNAKGITTKSWVTKDGKLREGKSWHKMHIYRILHNPIYIGQVSHKGVTYPGEHEPIIAKSLWDEVHSVLAGNRRNVSQHVRAKAPALLKGIIRCGACDRAMSPVSATHGPKSYRYYHCGKASKSGASACPVGSVPAGEIEGAVIQQLRAVFRTPEMIAQTYFAAQEVMRDELLGLQAEKCELEAGMDQARRTASLSGRQGETTTPGADLLHQVEDWQERLAAVNADIQALQGRVITEQEVADYLRRLDPVWEELFPLEQARLVQLLVEQVTVVPDGLSISIRSEGLHSLVSELKGSESRVEVR